MPQPPTRGGPITSSDDPAIRREGDKKLNRLARCPECSSTAFKAQDIDERTVRVRCVKCGWTPPDVKIEQMGDKETLR